MRKEYERPIIFKHEYIKPAKAGLETDQAEPGKGALSRA
jgi:hypothetical protein